MLLFNGEPMRVVSRIARKSSSVGTKLHYNCLTGRGREFPGALPLGLGMRLKETAARELILSFTPVLLESENLAVQLSHFRNASDIIGKQNP